MKSTVNEKDVLELLLGLKNAEIKYPTDMMTPRRFTYVEQVAAMTCLIKPGGNGTGSTSSDSSAFSSLAGIAPPIENTKHH